MLKKIASFGHTFNCSLFKNFPVSKYSYISFLTCLGGAYSKKERYLILFDLVLKG